MLFFVSVLLPSALPEARAAGAAPVAEAGLGLIAYVGDTVILDGSGSYDPEGDALHWQWTQVGGPPVEFDGPDTAQPSFTVDNPGTLRFELVVTDDLTSSAPDTVEVVVPYEQIDGVQTACATASAAPWAALAGVGLLFAMGRRRPRA